jgi:hypothetical protein
VAGVPRRQLSHAVFRGCRDDVDSVARLAPVTEDTRLEYGGLVPNRRIAFNAHLKMVHQGLKAKEQP